MEEFIYYNELYDIYKPLLTIKQQQYFEEYYYNNLSLSEISENYDISRNAISKQINVIRDKLKDYEKNINTVIALNKRRRLCAECINLFSFGNGI